MSTLSRHVLLPAIPLALFLLVAATPVEILGCSRRGLLAFAVALLGLAGAAAAVLKVYLVGRRSRDEALRWALTALLLMLPAAALLVLA